jgi:hypothetical protein
MKNKKKIDEVENILDFMASSMIMGGSLLNIFSQTIKDPRDNDEFALGYGITMKVDKTINDNRERYSRLYRDGNLISDKLFRLGGLNYGFEKKPYTSLLVYNNYPNETWGSHCIIDMNGKIVLEAESSFDTSFYYLDGVIAKYKDTFINLLTGMPIVKSYSTYMKSKDFFFVESKDYEKKFPEGVFKINFRTGEYEIFN